MPLSYRGASLLVAFLLTFSLYFSHVIYASNEKVLVITPEIKFHLNGGQNDSKKVTLFGLKDSTGLNLRSTELVDSNSGKVIPSDKIKLNTSAGVLDVTLNKGELKTISVSVPAMEAGDYKGNILVTQINSANYTSLTPLKLEAEVSDPPVWGEIIPIFSLGFVVSAVIWIVRAYITLKDRFRKVANTIKDIFVDFDVFQRLVKNKDVYILLRDFRFGQLYDAMDKSNVDESERRLEQTKLIFDLMIDNNNLKDDKVLLDKNVGNYSSISEYLSDTRSRAKQLKAERRISPEPTKEDIGRLEFYLFGYLTGKKLKRILAFNISAIILGLLVSLGTLLQQDFTKGPFSEFWIRFIVIFGIGVGADSIKQVFEKVISKENTE